ncbi:unnamed protein product [Nippostrongylus brasiliensis]|uniref:glutathione transferase n=1 Tax=Nippostrongylus brasiliensis TaxID=27835 RepID=A0A0N4YSW5_NIPBR|nr:unnamed protein product [Nippostrongylus brasiliensis]
MVHYKLIYFDIRGAAELIRQVFALAEQKYEDVRVPRDEWPKLKPGFAGKSAFDEALVDSLADQTKDFFNEVRPYFLANMGFSDGNPETLAKDLVLPAREKFFTFITKFLKNNKSGKRNSALIFQ